MGAAAWPLVARAQQPDRVRRIGALIGAAQDDTDTQARLAAFVQALAQLGWTDGRNVRIDYRWAAGNAENYRKYAAELVALAPDVVLAPGFSVGPMIQATRTVPIVFVFTTDPVGSGFVDSLARPGRNATGFMQFEFSLNAKWLELLKEIAPGVTRAAVLRDAAIPSGIGQFAVIQSVAPSVGVDVSPINLRDAGEIERGVDGIRAWRKWRPDRGGERVGDGSSRSNHYAGGPPQTARRLLQPRVRRRRRPDLLWG